MSRRHCNDEGEQIVDEGVECFVHERPPGQVSHRLQLIVDEQLRQHEQEAERVNSIHLKTKDNECFMSYKFIIAE